VIQFSSIVLKARRKIYFAVYVLLIVSGMSAQPLLAKPLNEDILNRWTVTTTELKPFAELLGAVNASEEEAIAFEAMSDKQQDKKVKAFLIKNKVYDQTTRIVKQHGWKSVGDYMRSSTQLGNAIAAYLQEGIIAGHPEDEAKAMREHVDPALAAVPKEDLEFIRRNAVTIKTFMQEYSQGVE
jgi:hypothetical protein